jgi:hypothetical protein
MEYIIIFGLLIAIYYFTSEYIELLFYEIHKHSINFFDKYLVGITIIVGIIINSIILNYNKKDKFLSGSNSNYGRLFHVIITLVPFGLIIFYIVQTIFNIIKNIIEYLKHYIEGK